LTYPDTMPGHGEITHYGHTSKGLRSTSYDDAWQDFTCGICDRAVHGVVVARYDDDIAWLMCPRCGGPHAYALGHTAPLPMPGPAIEGLPDAVSRSYDEARRALAARAPTGCELICRKILMHAAVDKAGAEKGKPFVTYIDALQAAHHVTPVMRPW
jgi:hypothetical protein